MAEDAGEGCIMELCARQASDFRGIKPRLSPKFFQTNRDIWQEQVADVRVPSYSRHGTPFAVHFALAILFCRLG